MRSCRETVRIIDPILSPTVDARFRRGDVPDLTADPASAEAELGFKALEDLETMCRDLWNWQQKNPGGYGE